MFPSAHQGRSWLRAVATTASVLISAFGLVAGTSSTALAAKGPKKTETVPGQYVVQLKKARSLYDAVLLEQKLQGKIVDQVRPDMVVVQRDPKEQKEAALRSLKDSQVVKLADPNYIFRANRTPNDPDYGKLWGLNNSGDLDYEKTRGLKGVDIGAERAWDITTGSKKVVVAVIDTGVDFRIPDLADNAWTNEAEANGQPGVDDDKNGYIDDIHGFNFINNTGNPTDDHSHGSHVSGTIGAKGDDGKGLAGVNWNVSIMAVKFLDAGGSGTLANAVKAMDYARLNGAKILSNSWGASGTSSIIQKAVEDTRDAGCLFVAAAGNESSDNDKYPEMPAGLPVDNILSVAAVNNRGDLADFSNIGIRSVHVAAPGVNVLSTVPAGTDWYSGTSMATPHVSGVAALLLAQNPTMTYQQLKDRIISTARPLHGLAGQISSGGMVDAYYALTNQKPPADPNDPSLWAETAPYQASTPHPYAANFTQTYNVNVPGAKRIAVRFSKFATEAGYDRVQFLNAAGESLGAISGKKDGAFSPIADGDTIVLKFTADGTVQDYGFDIDQVVVER